MNNTTILVGLIIVLVIVGGFVFLNSNGGVGDIITGEVDELDGDTQRVVISQNGYNYGDVQAEAGKPIAISLDSSVKGCLRAIVFEVEGKKYSKFLVTPEDILMLPALDEGIYDFACTMGMGFGKLRVG